MKNYLIPLCLCLSTHAYAQQDDALIKKDAFFKIGVESLSLNKNENMGMIGAAYMIETLDGLYLGPAAYGAVRGQRGGFFTGGGEAIYRYKINPKMSFDTGFYFGGGGGGAANVGGGMMLRPHVGLMWDFGGIRAGVSASQVKFPNGHISSNQLGLVFALDDTFNYFNPSQVGKNVNTSKRGGVGFDEVAIHLTQSKPINKNERTTRGGRAPASTSYAGFLMTQEKNNNWFWGVEAAGAVKGSSDGYAEVLGTVGVKKELNSIFSVGSRVSLGMGGGGGIDTGGGSLAKAALFSKIQLNPEISLGFEGGVVRALSGDFNGRYASVQMAIALDHPFRKSSKINNSSGSANESSVVEGWEWDAVAQRYTSAARRDHSERPLSNVGFKLNRKISEHFYLSGQAHSAMAGGAGAFSVGLLGLGWSSPAIVGNVRVNTEMLVGAAGGGGVDSDGGAIVQPMAYLNIPVNPHWHVKAGVGRVKSLKGNLNSPVLEFSLSYQLGLPRR